MLYGSVFVEFGVHVVPRTQALNRGKLITYQRYITATKGRIKKVTSHNFLSLVRAS